MSLGKTTGEYKTQRINNEGILNLKENKHKRNTEFKMILKNLLPCRSNPFSNPSQQGRCVDDPVNVSIWLEL